MSGIHEGVWIAATIGVYATSRWCYGRVRSAALNPALVSIAGLMALVHFSGTSFPEYQTATRPLSFLLGPAVVALGAPLAVQLGTIRRNLGAVTVAILIGSVVGAVVAVAVSASLGAPVNVVRSLAPRSVTTPVAMAISARVGGMPSLSALVSITTGVIGGVIGPELLRRIGVRSRLAVGLALGAAAHGLGTARAAEEGEVESSASGMAMGLMAVATAVLVPALLVLASAVVTIHR